MGFCEVYLTRHGETDSNLKHIIQGQADVPLNQMGKMQAGDLQKDLAKVNFSAIFSSDLSRAFTTAEIVRGDRNLEIHKSVDLRERCMQVWQGNEEKDIVQEIQKQGIQLSQLTKKEFVSFNPPPGTIESFAQLYKRFEKFAQSELVSYRGESVLVLTEAY